MIKSSTWKKRLVQAVAGGVLILTVGSAFAAPRELTLEESIALALRNNPSVKIAQAERDKSAWAVREAQAGKGPTLGFTHTESRLQSAPSTTIPNPTPYSYYDNKLSLSLPLYSGGRLEGLIDQAKYSLQYNDLGVAKTRQQLKLDATTAYYSVLQTRNLLQVGQESVDNLAAHLKNVQAQYEVGTVAKSDVLRSEVALADAQQSLIKAQNANDIAVAKFNNVVGLPLDTEIKLSEELKHQQIDRSLGDSVSFALQYRPDVAQADATLAGSREGVKVARSGYLPTVNLNGSTGWNDREFPGSHNNNWGVSVTASLTLFDTNLTRSKVRESQAAVTKAQEQVRQTRDSAALEVREAYLGMQEAEKRIETSRVTVAKAEEDFKIAQVRYSAGVGTNLDVIDAELALATAKTNYIQALYDFNTSRAKLDKAMGVAVK